MLAELESKEAEILANGQRRKTDENDNPNKGTTVPEDTVKVESTETEIESDANPTTETISDNDEANLVENCDSFLY